MDIVTPIAILFVLALATGFCPYQQDNIICQCLLKLFQMTITKISNMTVCLSVFSMVKA